MLKKIRSSNGFTLIELLIVVAIIGALSAIAFFGSQGVFEGGRDQRRRHDMREYQAALETYASKNSGLYPARTTGGFSTDNVSIAGGLCGYLSLTACPADPKNVDPYLYTYRANNATSGCLVNGVACATRYWLRVKLEDPKDPAYSWWVVCSTGVSGLVATNSTSWADVDVFGGQCPSDVVPD